jgi:hypothetical protein
MKLIEFANFQIFIRTTIWASIALVAGCSHSNSQDVDGGSAALGRQAVDSGVAGPSETGVVDATTTEDSSVDSGSAVCRLENNVCVGGPFCEVQSITFKRAVCKQACTAETDQYVYCNVQAYDASILCAVEVATGNIYTAKSGGYSGPPGEFRSCTVAERMELSAAPAQGATP